MGVLLRLSGIENKIITGFLAEWSVVADWNPEMRYRAIGREPSRCKIDDRFDQNAVGGVMTKQLLYKFMALERDLAAEKGRFVLFALFLREYARSVDFVVSAPWLKTDEMATYRYFATQLQSRLEPQEMLMLARIVLIKKDNPGLEAVHDAATVEHGLVQIWNREFF